VWGIEGDEDVGECFWIEVLKDIHGIGEGYQILLSGFEGE
jgi:hypothetical protein